MWAKQNPAPLAGGDRARFRFAELRSNTKNRSPEQALRRQRQVERVCLLGPRVVSELLIEIGRRHDILDDIDQRLARYAEIDPAMLAAVGGDRFPASPIRAVAP